MSDCAAKIEQSEYTLGKLLAWIQAADTRVRLIMPLSTAMLGVLAVLAPDMGAWTVCGGITVTISVLMLSLAIVFTGLSSFPRTSGPLGSLIYFGGIVSRDLQQFSNDIHSRSNEEYLEDLIRQCHINAQIAERKFYWVQRSMICLFVATIPWIISITILYTQ